MRIKTGFILKEAVGIFHFFDAVRYIGGVRSYTEMLVKIYCFVTKIAV